ncbi:hypothetical protein CR513_37322, partial [Mucuna pruriens]
MVGIKHEKTPPKTPWLNDLTKRMNKTLIERVRCILSEAKLPKHFWGEALYTIVHDEYDYRLHDPIKKLVKSGDVKFMKDQTIKDIDKVKKTTLGKNNIRMFVHDLDTVENNVQNGEQHNYLGNDFDVRIDDDTKEE